MIIEWQYLKMTENQKYLFLYVFQKSQSIPKNEFCFVPHIICRFYFNSLNCCKKFITSKICTRHPHSSQQSLPLIPANNLISVFNMQTRKNVFNRLTDSLWLFRQTIYRTRAIINLLVCTSAYATGNYVCHREFIQSLLHHVRVWHNTTCKTY